MKWEEWSPIYEEILSEFGWSKEGDVRARDLLRSLVPHAQDPSIFSFLSGKTVGVVGAGPSLERTEIPPIPLLVADGAVERLHARGGRIAGIVTDLDGNIKLEVDLNRKGIPVALHAHGDNVEAIRTWAPQFQGPLLLTTSAPPLPPVFNLGGFTDGDRACFLAKEVGAREIVLLGFDWDEPDPDPRRSPEITLKKLRFARRLIGSLGLPVRQVAPSLPPRT